MGTDEKHVIESFLTRLGIEHRFVRHAPITSVQEALEKGVPAQLGISLENVMKNLLVRDSQHRLFLLVAPGMNRVNLRVLARQLHLSHLSMARLDEARGLFGEHKGAVSLFDVLTPKPENVEVTLVVDEDIAQMTGEIAFPAGSDRESVVIPADHFASVVEEVGAQSGTPTQQVKLPKAQ
jgi:hypothetical protein